MHMLCIKKGLAVPHWIEMGWDGIVHLTTPAHMNRTK